MQRIFVLTIVIFNTLHPHYLSAQWTRVGFSGSDVPAIHSFGHTLLASVLGPPAQTSFYRSGDGGVTWDSLSTVDAAIYEIQHIGDTLFASTHWACTEICLPGPSLFRSVDSGASWQTVFSARSGVDNLIAHNGILFIGEGNAYLKSLDRGETWQEAGFTFEGVGRLISIGNVLYGTAMFESTDSGQTWLSIRGDLPLEIILNITANEVYLFAFDNNGIYRSGDGGQNWVPRYSGIPPEIRLWRVVANGQYLVASSALNVFFSNNDGDMWQDITGNLTLRGFGSIYAIIFVENFLIAITDEGIWQRDYSSLTPVDIPDHGKHPTKFVLKYCYPNPFNPRTKIVYAIPRSAFVALLIYDLHGRRQKTLVSKFQQAGEYAVIFDAENLAGGVYFYQLLAGGRSVGIGKMVLAK